MKVKFNRITRGTYQVRDDTVHYLQRSLGKEPQLNIRPKELNLKRQIERISTQYHSMRIAYA